MIPDQFSEANAILASRQERYEPVAVYVFNDPEGRIALSFRLSPSELEEIARTKTIWVQQLTFGHSFQPLAISTQKPEGME